MSFFYNNNMKNLIIKSHYDDNKLIYDNDLEMYVLNFTYVKSNIDINFEDDGVVEKRIKLNSRKIYNHIYSNGNSQNREVVEFLLNNTEQGRKLIFQALLAQFEADNETGYNDLTKQPLIDLASGKNAERHLVKANEICIDAENIIDQSAGIIGINVVYAGVYPWYYFNMARAFGGK